MQNEKKPTNAHHVQKLMKAMLHAPKDWSFSCDLTSEHLWNLQSHPTLPLQLQQLHYLIVFDDEMLSVLRRKSAKRMCACEFKPGDIAWNCKECQVRAITYVRLSILSSNRCRSMKHALCATIASLLATIRITKCFSITHTAEDVVIAGIQKPGRQKDSVQSTR